MFKTALVPVLILFSVLSAAALWQVGYLGIFAQQFVNYGTWQVLIDLFIAVGIGMYWMWLDAQKNRPQPVAVAVVEPGCGLVWASVVFADSQGRCACCSVNGWLRLKPSQLK